ncbi:hypothetical protein M0802_016259 [Mischocyttarus mexicanus]|nr:hypothetical protein M0802_016259 [Mischocyttarus mexicanus]
MEALKRKRTTARIAFTKVYNTLNALLDPIKGSSRDEISNSLAQMVSRAKELAVISKSYMDLRTEVDDDFTEEEREHEVVETLDYEYRHVTLMCPVSDDEEIKLKGTANDKKDIATNECSLVSCCNDAEVLMPTLRVKLRNGNEEMNVRLIMDNGSQKSYITKGAVYEMGYEPIDEQTMSHSLFGGRRIETVRHKKYRVHLSSIDDHYRCILIESENKKRIDWPLARVEKLIYGKDDKVRVVRLNTATGSLVRPIQRIYPLELKSDTSESQIDTVIVNRYGKNHSLSSPKHADSTNKHCDGINDGRVTRSGRVSRRPDRLSYEKVLLYIFYSVMWGNIGFILVRFPKEWRI